MGFFEKLKNGLGKTKNSINEKINNVLSNFRKVDEELLEELEEVLIMSDIGATTSSEIIDMGGDNIDYDLGYVYKINRKDALYLKETIALADKNIAQVNEAVLIENKNVKSEVEQIVKAVNYAYKTSKSDFIWEEKVKQNKQSVQAQLDGVSKAISSIAVKIEKENKKDDIYIDKKKKTITALEIKGILVDELEIQEKENRTFIDIYLKEDSKTSENKDIEKIKNVLEKTFKEKFVINEVKTKKLNKQCKRAFCYMAEDKFLLQIGQASRVKNGSPISGDSCLQIRLSDGKYLLAISDGMESGPEARKSSQIAIKMLERLLMSGFDKDTSIDLINTTIMNTNEEIFATLDIIIVDLFNGKVEFIKNGACPTFVKNGKNVQIVKSLSLPAGILKDINLTVYDKDIINQDILVMCSDGIIDANVEYKNKELWVKYILEDIETTSAQKIADIILNEAVDNNYGIIKDDMSLIVCKILKI